MAVLNITSYQGKTLRRFRDTFDRLYQEPVKAQSLNKQATFNFYITYARVLREVYAIMSNKKPQKSKKVAWQGYANVYITSEHITPIAEYCADDVLVWKDFVHAIRDGYSIKFSFDTENKTFRCNMYCSNSNSVNAGYSLSAWASDTSTALGVVLYKHYRIAGEDWASVSSSQKQDFG